MEPESGLEAPKHEPSTGHVSRTGLRRLGRALRGAGTVCIDDLRATCFT